MHPDFVFQNIIKGQAMRISLLNSSNETYKGNMSWLNITVEDRGMDSLTLHWSPVSKYIRRYRILYGPVDGGHIQEVMVDGKWDGVILRNLNASTEYLITLTVNYVSGRKKYFSLTETTKPRGGTPRNDVGEHIKEHSQLLEPQTFSVENNTEIYKKQVPVPTGDTGGNGVEEQTAMSPHLQPSQPVPVEINTGMDKPQQVTAPSGGVGGNDAEEKARRDSQTLQSQHVPVEINREINKKQQVPVPTGDTGGNGVEEQTTMSSHLLPSQPVPMEVNKGMDKPQQVTAPSGGVGGNDEEEKARRSSQTLQSQRVPVEINREMYKTQQVTIPVGNTAGSGIQEQTKRSSQPAPAGVNKEMYKPQQVSAAGGNTTSNYAEEQSRRNSQLPQPQRAPVDINREIYKPKQVSVPTRVTAGNGVQGQAKKRTQLQQLQPVSDKFKKDSKMHSFPPAPFPARTRISDTVGQRAIGRSQLLQPQPFGLELSKEMQRPQHLMVTDITSNSMSASWAAPNEWVLQYHVQHIKPGGQSSVVTLSSHIKQVFLQTLQPDSLHVVCVAALYRKGRSDSVCERARTLSAPLPVKNSNCQYAMHYRRNCRRQYLLCQPWMAYRNCL
ncbi:uncharacterized protein LOC122807960 [Protopterus annectens]|uniref:uncharacterized protein LOC122807960 n=1 Tax=Protopterus annectens TaxID=7888 RepID=UPI001CFBC347|nr:uncharacterized protein LOC122807960 [Protopterus annectens]